MAPSRAPQPSPGAPQGSGGEPNDPLSRRLMAGVRILALLLLLVLVNSFVNKSESGEEPLEFNPVAAAAERTDKEAGARFSAYVVYSSPALARSISASGTGAYNAKTERSRVTLKAESPIPLHVVQITDGDVEYDGGATIEEELPPGKHWVRTTEAEAAEDDEASLNVDDSLEMLRTSGGVEMVGRESVNGKSTRRYRGEIQVGDFVDYLREKGKDEVADSYERIEGVSPTGISAECWIDRKNLLRRFRVVMPMPGEPDEPPLTVDMRIDFYDYGAQPDIKLPDPDSVVEGPLEDDASSSSASIS